MQAALESKAANREIERGGKRETAFFSNGKPHALIGSQQN